MNDQIRSFHKKMLFPMIDSDPGIASTYSLTIAFSEPSVGIRAFFLHDFHHGTSIHHPG
jgi:hypothetical protein